jgi:hypothetical protein
MTITIEGNNSMGSLLKKVTHIVGSRMLCRCAVMFETIEVQLGCTMLLGSIGRTTWIHD